MGLYRIRKGVMIMKIYPKISDDLEGLESLRSEIEESKGIELQFFHNEGIWGNFNIVSSIEALINEIPSIEEVTIHPPLNYYDIELVISKDINIIKKQLRECVELSEKYNIKVNLLYHTVWPIEMIEQDVLSKIKEVVNLIEGTKVQILIENIYTSLTERNRKCTIIEICNRINSSHLKICLDICHLHCLANILQKDFDNFIKEYIDKELAAKYIYQIHFAATKNNDGYIDRKTHGRKHDDLEELKQDYRILEDLNLTNTNIVTEISEDDYINRLDQKYEIELLKKLK